MARTLICENDLPKSLWDGSVNTVNYVLCRCYIQLLLKNIPCEYFKCKKPNVSNFKSFESECFIYNNGNENLGKFVQRTDEGVFGSYFFVSKAYHVYNKHTEVIEESIYVILDETNDSLGSSSSFDEFRLRK